MEQLGLLQALGSLGETIEEEYGTLCQIELPTPHGRAGTMIATRRSTTSHASRRCTPPETRRRPITIRLSTASDSGELDVSAPACPPLVGAAVLLLRERASRIGGQIEISSGTETRVVLTAPLHR